MKRGRKKLPSFSALEAKLDRVFSVYIRRRDADEGGTVACVTCGKLMHWTGDGAQAGHFVRRDHRATRWDERNVHVQCVYCNKFQNGEEGEHGAYIIRRYGLAVHEELLALKRTIRKHTRADLEEMIERFTNAGRELDGAGEESSRRPLQSQQANPAHGQREAADSGGRETALEPGF